MESIMFNKAIILGTAALAALAFAGPALAVSGTSGPVNVTVTIAPTVSVWGADAALTLDGSNSPDNSDAVLSSIGYINNVDANISASVAGLPTASDGFGIQFHIFDNITTAAALAAINGNQYDTPGAINFHYNNETTPQTLITNTGVNTVAHNEPIVYAAGLPGDLPAPMTANVVVTYTITSN